MNSCLILIYHRVTELENDPFLLAVQPHRFEAQIECLKKHKNIITVTELLDRISTKRSISQCAVISFDDGYADNFLNAKPILEKLEAGAIFFVTAGKINSKQEFWWDELERFFFAEKKLPLSNAPFISGEKRYLDLKSQESKTNACLELHKSLKYANPEQRNEILEKLYDWADIDRNQARKTHRIMTANEIKTLSDSDFFELGSHSMNHTPFKSLSEPEIRRELTESKEILETITGHPIFSFCFPFGLKRDISRKAMGLVKESGYKCAFSNIPKNFSRIRNLFKIPRRLVRNWNKTEFEKHIFYK